MLKKWITNGTNRPFMARKSLRLEKKLRSAAACVCGLGQFNFYVNGLPASDHVLDPAWTDYDRLVQYVQFDVTQLLQPGENILAFEVGNGWYCLDDRHYTFHFPSFMPPNPNPYRPFGQELLLAARIELRFEDGTLEAVELGEECRVAPHPVVMSNVFGSETMLGELVQPGWMTAGFDDGQWRPAQLCSGPKGELTPALQPPIRVIREYAGRLLGHVNGRDVYDFGQNCSALLSFEVRGRRGDTVYIYPAEKLSQDGDVDQTAKGWTEVDVCVTYVIGTDDVWERYESAFTYIGGRYVAVAREGERPELRGITAKAITSAVKRDGSFACSDQRYEQIYDLVEKTVEANLLSVHTDCPTIERFAWQEPNHLMAPSIFYMKDGKALWEKFFRDMRTAQHSGRDYFLDMKGERFYPGDGLIPSQAPCYMPNVLPVPGLGSFYDTIAWGSACIIGVRWHYLFYGELRVVADNFDAGLRYFRYLTTKASPDGMLGYGLGDWGHPRRDYCRENVETALLYADGRILQEFARLLQREEDAAWLEPYLVRLKDSYNQKLLVRHPDKGYFCYRAYDHGDSFFATQACQALPLYWGLTPRDKEADVAMALEDLLKSDGSFVCGEISLPYVIQTASRYGLDELICRYITKPEHPSYYAFVLDGETTLGEYWEKNPRSHCHDMMGHIIEWYYNGLAGIHPVSPGFSRIKLRPYLPEGMERFRCSYQSVGGPIAVQVEDAGDELILQVWVSSSVQYTVDVSRLKRRGKPIRRKLFAL